MPDFLDVDRILKIAHIFGAILGAGGAFASDTIFLNSIKDGMIEKTEMRFIRLMSKLVWAGLALLILSGICLFMLSPEEYLHSSKFLAKMTIVLVVFLNGVVFHIFHIPLLESTSGAAFRDSLLFRNRALGLMISGGISMTSWIAAVILGMLRSLPYNYGIIIGIYFILLLGAIISATFLKKKLLHL